MGHRRCNSLHDQSACGDCAWQDRYHLYCSSQSFSNTPANSKILWRERIAKSHKCGRCMGTICKGSYRARGCKTLWHRKFRILEKTDIKRIFMTSFICQQLRTLWTDIQPADKTEYLKTQLLAMGGVAAVATISPAVAAGLAGVGIAYSLAVTAYKPYRKQTLSIPKDFDPKTHDVLQCEKCVEGQLFRSQ